MKRPGRGGPRPNSGRKTELQGQPTKRYNFTLDARTTKLLQVLGGGNASKGIRVAANAAFDAYQAGRLDID